MCGARLAPRREAAREPQLLRPVGQEIGVERQDHRRRRHVVARLERASERQARPLLRSVAGDRRIADELGLGEARLDAPAQVADDRRRRSARRESAARPPGWRSAAAPSPARRRGRSSRRSAPLCGRAGARDHHHISPGSGPARARSPRRGCPDAPDCLRSSSAALRGSRPAARCRSPRARRRSRSGARLPGVISSGRRTKGMILSLGLRQAVPMPARAAEVPISCMKPRRLTASVSSEAPGGNSRFAAAASSVEPSRSSMLRQERPPAAAAACPSAFKIGSERERPSDDDAFVEACAACLEACAPAWPPLYSRRNSSVTRGAAGSRVDVIALGEQAPLDFRIAFRLPGHVGDLLERP